MAWRTSSVRESIPFLTGSDIKEYLRNIGQWGYLAKGAERSLHLLLVLLPVSE